MNAHGGQAQQGCEHVAAALPRGTNVRFREGEFFDCTFRWVAPEGHLRAKTAPSPLPRFRFPVGGEQSVGFPFPAGGHGWGHLRPERRWVRRATRSAPSPGG